MRRGFGSFFTRYHAPPAAAAKIVRLMRPKPILNRVRENPRVPVCVMPYSLLSNCAARIQVPPPIERAKKGAKKRPARRRLGSKTLSSPSEGNDSEHPGMKAAAG